MLIRREYEDESGQKFIVEVPEGHENELETGIVIGPPDLYTLNLPVEMRIALHNQLFDRKLLTWSDVRRRPGEIEAALKAVLKTGVRQIRELYMEVKDA